MVDGQHVYIVTISNCSKEQADKVINERLSWDEWYGFDYNINFKSSTATDTSEGLPFIVKQDSDTSWSPIDLD